MLRSAHTWFLVVPLLAVAGCCLRSTSGTPAEIPLRIVTLEDDLDLEQPLGVTTLLAVPPWSDPAPPAGDPERDATRERARSELIEVARQVVSAAFGPTFVTEDADAIETILSARATLLDAPGDASALLTHAHEAMAVIVVDLRLSSGDLDARLVLRLYDLATPDDYGRRPPLARPRPLVYEDYVELRDYRASRPNNTISLLEGFRELLGPLVQDGHVGRYLTALDSSDALLSDGTALDDLYAILGRDLGHLDHDAVEAYLFPRAIPPAPIEDTDTDAGSETDDAPEDPAGDPPADPEVGDEGVVPR